MFDLMNCCSICLQADKDIANISENDVSNVQIISKLKSCVPDIEWHSDDLICCTCLSQLNIVYSFHKLCVNSYKIRQNHKFSSVNAESNRSSVRNESAVNIDNEKTCYYDNEKDSNNILHNQILENENKKDLDSSFDNQISDDENQESQCSIADDACHSSEEVKPKNLELANSNLNCTNLRRRIRDKHFECSNCGKKYVTLSSLKKHMVICKRSTSQSRNDKDPSSEIPKRGCEAPNEFLTDQNEEVRTEEPPTLNSCNICGHIFTNKYLLKRHLRNVHTNEKKYSCELCTRKFASPVYLNAHMRYHKRERNHICAFCGKGFITASDLYHHEKIHANKRSYKCDECSKAFNTSSDLHKHRICVHLDRSHWKYECIYCQRRFPLKTNLDTHIKTHTGERNYACNICDKRCINRSILARHMETHNDVQAYKCNVCLQGYKYKKSLELHMAKLHGVGELPVKEKKYFCHMCPKSYFANNKLQKHILNHTGEKPFKCPSCLKGFVDKTYVKHHLKVVHGIIDWQSTE